MVKYSPRDFESHLRGVGRPDSAPDPLASRARRSVRHPFGPAARDVVAGRVETSARAGKGWTTAPASLWARPRNAVGGQAAETSRAMGRGVSQILGRIARSAGRVFGKDNQDCGERKVNRMCPVVHRNYGSDRGRRDLKRRTDRVGRRQDFGNENDNPNQGTTK